MPPSWQAKQYAVIREGVEDYAYCPDASKVFRFCQL